jgi:hypothetical protein
VKSPTAPKRLCYTRGDTLPPGAKLVTRGSRWGNPYPICQHRSREQAIAQFAELLVTRRPRDEWLCSHVDPIRRNPAAYPPDEDIRRLLAGFDLACACPLAEPCHAERLLIIANAPEALW